jgi:hypothetical protein
VSGLDDPCPAGDWESFRAARNRFLARVRPEAMDDPPDPVCPEAPPAQWPPFPSEAGADTETAGG